MAQNLDAVKELFAKNPELLEQLAGIKDRNELSRRAAEIAKQHGVVSDPGPINSALTKLSDEDLERLVAAGTEPKKGPGNTLFCDHRPGAKEGGGWVPW